MIDLSERSIESSRHPSICLVSSFIHPSHSHLQLPSPLLILLGSTAARVQASAHRQVGITLTTQSVRSVSVGRSLAPMKHRSADKPNPFD
mmetsp:Transcript_42986/g.121816  ORF Transcript_42986/g.121816 Transcript_42986/m.121816 type:complete len:90 (-) Transcript_42986:193-462(-)